MTSSPSLAGRALLAVVLMLGFYVLALAFSLVLFYLPYAEIKYAHRIHLKLVVFCVLGGLAILWSVLPRRDKFEPPGPRLTPEQQPRLFEAIENVARSVKQEMPAEVYLVPDVNAWVGQRGGIMGFGSRRVMGLGLPLLRLLTCAQFRAVLAHEFGHYHGGDTKLGPWIYKTRGAIGRTLASLHATNGENSILQLPFLWYAKMFLRVTHAVSRRQEFVADELAARTVGSKPLIEGLRTVHGVGSAFGVYWEGDCAPVLRAGFRPPLLEGFEQFLGSREVAETINKHMEDEMKTGKADPYDTHPPLKDRIAAVESYPEGEVASDDPTALALLLDEEGLEAHLLDSVTESGAAKELQPITWSEVGTRVYLPQWHALLKANAQGLGGITPEAIGALATNAKALGRRFVTPGGEKVPDEEAEGLAGAVVGAALATLLVSQGRQLDASPGHPITISAGSVQLEPFNVVSSIAGGSTNMAAWQNQCAELGIQGTDLGRLAVPAA